MICINPSATISWKDSIGEKNNEIHFFILGIIVIYILKLPFTSKKDHTEIDFRIEIL